MSHKTIIRRNAAEIVRLHRLVHETAAHKNDGAEAQLRWTNACSDFHTCYSELAFVNGVETARDRLRSGDQEAIEYALDFLEVRPYFFRSGYMFKDFLRVLRNCRLTAAQRSRHTRILDRYRDFRLRRQAADS